MEVRREVLDLKASNSSAPSSPSSIKWLGRAVSTLSPAQTAMMLGGGALTIGGLCVAGYAGMLENSELFFTAIAATAIGNTCLLGVNLVNLVILQRVRPLPV